VVQVASQGCFHDYTVDLTFRRTSEELFTVTARAWSGYRPGASATASAHLTVQDISVLDRHVDRYRAASNSGFCTTHTQVRLTRLREGLVLQAESLEDTSCEVRSRDGEDVPVAFNDLLTKALDALHDVAAARRWLSRDG
jgi:hypothetical protein